MIPEDSVTGGSGMQPLVPSRTGLVDSQTGVRFLKSYTFRRSSTDMTGYPNTDGLGLLEYLDFIEDIGAVRDIFFSSFVLDVDMPDQEPILAIWSGIVVNDYSNLTGWPVVPEDQLQPYVDDAINEIEFVTGDANTTKYGALRASLGREKPYQLRYIEIGNEDQVRC
jgi:alpha-L-arabinofuranosidase